MNYAQCPRCGSTQRVEVHGHAACAGCHLVLEECCQGECTTPGMDDEYPCELPGPVPMTAMPTMPSAPMAAAA